MHNRSSTHRVITIAAVVAALLLSGCETTTNWLKGRKTADPTDELILDSTEANVYLNEMFELISGYPAAQAEIFADAESAATLTPGPSTQLRYALVLATPGHSGSNDAEAQRLLRDILAQTEMMTTAETSLATIYLRDVETRMVLNSESRRLRSASTQAATTEDAAISQRMARIEAENRQLRESLAEAEGKLEAITSIERSIREQSGDNDPQ
jgi:hypothetical protein